MDRELVAEAKRRNLPVTLADQAATSFANGVKANAATDSELDSRIPGTDKTYRDGIRTLSAVQSDAEAQKAAALAAPYDPQHPDKPDPSRPSILQLQEFATRAPAFTDGSLVFVADELAAKSGNMDRQEARERITAIQAKYRHLSVAQAADLAFQSEERWNSFGWNAATSPEVRTGALMYKEVDRLGGKTGIDRIASERTYKFDKVLSELPQAARQLSGSARTGTSLPLKIIEWNGQLTKAQAKKAAEDAAAAAEQADAALLRARNPGLQKERL